MSSAPVLVLWDIDHTLVDARGIARTLVGDAIERLTGTRPDRLADMAGRTDLAILAETCALNGVAAPPFDAYCAALAEVAAPVLARLREFGRCLPGAHEAVAALARDGVLQSVVTGNIPAVARMKLEAFGLAGLLDCEVGGYGDDGTDRAVLVRLARERAARKYGPAVDEARVVVVGDTPHDVRGALASGAVAVAVASGASGAAELAAAGAHAVLVDLTDVDTLRAAVLRGVAAAG